MATSGIREAYETGKGPITVRGRAYIEGMDAGTSEGELSQGARTTPSILCTMSTSLCVPKSLLGPCNVHLCCCHQ